MKRELRDIFNTDVFIKRIYPEEAKKMPAGLYLVRDRGDGSIRLFRAGIPFVPLGYKEYRPVNNLFDSPTDPKATGEK